MPTTSRPDLLPFAKPARIGLPYHGLCTDGKVGAITHEQPITGDAVLVQHPLASAPTLPNGTGENWQNYALLSGATRQIGGQALGTQRWIYCGASYSWVISFELEKAGITQTISIWLESPFGLLPAKTMNRRKLCEFTYTPLTYAGASQSTASAAMERRFFLSHSKTGAKSVINVAAYTPSSPLHGWTKSCLPYDFLKRYYGAYGIHNALIIQLSGDGSLEDGEVGSGISGTIASLRTAPEMVISESSSSDVDGDYWGEFFMSGEIVSSGPTQQDPSTWESELWLGTGETSQTGEGKTSAKTTTASASTIYEFLDTVKTDGVLSALRLSSVSESTDAYAEEIDSSKLTTVVTPIEPYGYELSHSGSSTYTATRTYTATVDIDVSWCGAAFSAAYQSSGSSAYEFVANYWDPGNPTYIGGTGTGDASLAITPTCTVNGGTISCSDTADVVVYRVTNGLLSVVEDGADTVDMLTLVGTTHSVSSVPASTEASLDPGSAAFSYEAGKSICYV